MYFTGLKYTKLKVLFQNFVLPSVVFGIPIANGEVHGMIKLNVKVPRQS
jgi:hypothetical protein